MVFVHIAVTDVIVILSGLYNAAASAYLYSALSRSPATPPTCSDP